VRCIVFDTVRVFVCNSIVDAPVDAFTGVFVGEDVSKITVSSLVYLLVMTVPWFAVAASVSTTTVATSRLTTVVVGRATAVMCAGPW
jgi:hypothetical protein